MAIEDLESQRVTQLPERHITGVNVTTVRLLQIINTQTIMIKALQRDIVALEAIVNP
jgi:hypothetical protein